MKQKDTLIVLSGGMDSTTMLYDYKDQIALAVNFSYGSNHNDREARCARLHCERLGIELIEIDMSFIGKYFESSLLRGADAIPDGTYAESNIHSTVVPFRNGIMLSVAAGLAESRKLSRVIIATHAGDHSIYPDCREEFIEAMGEAVKCGTFDHIKIRAPYGQINKTVIARRAAELGVDLAETYSCYKGGEVHCGTCATCIERREAIADAGIDDPTLYLN